MARCVAHLSVGAYRAPRLASSSTANSLGVGTPSTSVTPEALRKGCVFPGRRGSLRGPFVYPEGMGIGVGELVLLILGLVAVIWVIVVKRQGAERNRREQQRLAGDVPGHVAPAPAARSSGAWGVLALLVIGVLLYQYLERRAVTEIEEQQTLEDGSFRSYKLSEGLHEIVISSSGGLDVSIAGTDCIPSHEKPTYRQTCRVLGVANLTVMNPSLLGLGSPVQYSIRVVRNP